MIEVNNLLSNNRDFTIINIEDIDAIGRKYKIAILKKYRLELQNIYKRFLKYCFIDKILDDFEIRQLSHLKHIFDLDDNIIRQIHKDISLEIFNESVDEAIADGKLDDKERDFLNKLQTRLKLPDNIVKTIYSKKSSEYIQNYLKSAVSDERLSPDEEMEMNIIAQNLGITIKFDEKTKDLIDKFRLYWLIENGEIPIVETEINLQKNEKCYFSTSAKWYEYRKVTQRIRYGGPTFRVRIVKGLYWRAGDLGVQTVSNDILTLLDSGTLYLTNNRVIFIGNRNTKTIKHSKVLDFTPHKNGIEILKDTGKSPFIEFERGIDIFAMIFGRVIKEI